MVSYVFAIIVGALAVLLGYSRVSNRQDREFQAKDEQLSNTIQKDRDSVQQSQETADDLVKKYEEESRDYSKPDDGSSGSGKA